jgi:hypothetical protein
MLPPGMVAVKKETLHVVPTPPLNCAGSCKKRKDKSGCPSERQRVIATTQLLDILSVLTVTVVGVYVLIWKNLGSVVGIKTPTLAS